MERIFISGTPEGLPGWIETHRLDKGAKFMVATSGPAKRAVQDWGETKCGSFRELEITGLPLGWSLFEGQNASDSCENVDVLTVSPSARLVLRGGVKLRGGNTYLNSARPVIVLENLDQEVAVTINGVPLIKEDDLNIWHLPDDTKPNEVLRIEAKTGEEELRKIMRLEEPRLHDSFAGTPWRNAQGHIVPDTFTGIRIRGAIVSTATTGISPFPDFRPKPWNRMVFIGSIPGQIAEWPDDPYPVEWSPVWSLQKTGRDHWRVSCCRNSSDCIPMPDLASRPSDNKNVKKWKKYIWINRRKIETPGIPLIRQKWLSFSGAAQHV